MAKLAWALASVLATSALFSATASPAAAPNPPETNPPVPLLPSTPPPKGDESCSTVIFGMMDCLDYVSAGSNVSKPDESCCDGVKAVVQVSPSCLCEALSQAADMNIDVNMTRAVGLPAVCKISVPDLGNCGTASSPDSAPAPSAPKTPPPSPATPAPELPSPAPALPSPTPPSPATPAPALPPPAPALPLPAPPSPVVQPPPDEPPTTSATRGVSAPAPSASGAASRTFDLLVLVISIAVATGFYC